MAFFGNFRSDARMQTVMNRMNALGLEYLGPRDSSGENVPTYHTPRQDPTTATTQFDTFSPHKIPRQHPCPGDERRRRMGTQRPLPNRRRGFRSLVRIKGLSE